MLYSMCNVLITSMWSSVVYLVFTVLLFRRYVCKWDYGLSTVYKEIIINPKGKGQLCDLP